MKLTRKGYLIITSVILLLALSGGGYLYYSSPTVQSLVAPLFSKGTSGSTPTPAATATANPTEASPTLATSRDTEIKATLLQEILQNNNWRNSDIHPEVKDGVVNLKGTIINETERVALDRYTRNLQGVKNLVDTLEIKAAPLPNSKSTPTPGEDPNERLAKEVEFTCYKTDAFDVHLLQVAAKSGEITLRGYVRSRAERLLAEHIARESAGVISVNNLLEIKDGKETKDPPKTTE